MSKANITAYMQNNPNGLFLKTSAEYLGLYHGDTETTHPYVCREMVDAFTRSVMPAVNAIVASVRDTSAPVRLSWHAQYCLGKFGQITPPTL